MDAAKLISLLELSPHPVEGGYFRETYRSDEMLIGTSLPVRYKGARSISTAIYYLLTPDTFSVIHRVSTDEVFHFYLGDPVQMIQLYPDGSTKLITLGHDIEAGEELQVVVPFGTWQGACLIPGGKFSLLGATVAPGFEYDDYEEGKAAELLAKYSAHHELIKQLTRSISTN